MSVVSSKNTWYLIFSALFVLIVGIIAYKALFLKKSDQQKLAASPSPTPAVLKSTLLPSPTPSPSPSVSPSPSPSPTPNSDLKIVEKDGVTYVSTEKTDGKDTNSTNKATALAQASTVSGAIRLPVGYATDIGSFITRALRFILVIAALLVFYQLILGGINWITSGGDKAKTEAARQKIVAAVIGLIIVASSYAILQLVLTFIGYSSLNALLQSSFGGQNTASDSAKTATTSAKVIIDGQEQTGSASKTNSKTKGGL